MILESQYVELGECICCLRKIYNLTLMLQIVKNKHKTHTPKIRWNGNHNQDSLYFSKRNCVLGQHCLWLYVFTLLKFRQPNQNYTLQYIQRHCANLIHELIIPPHSLSSFEHNFENESPFGWFCDLTFIVVAPDFLMEA